MTGEAHQNNQNMAYVTIEDLVGQVEAIVFPEGFREVQWLTSGGFQRFVRGRANLGEKENKLILSDMISS